MSGDTILGDTLQRGTRLGRYEIREMLGRGGMGQVYRAWDLLLTRDVAVKVLGVPDAELLARFEREAEAISQLDHPNVVSIHDFQADGARPYIVMEYLQGEDLSARLRRGPLSIGEAADIVLSVCSAVHACHALGIIHRDLKPGNVFLHRTVELGVVVKVLDFGVAMLRQEVLEGITQPGHVVGTPRYLSPEQVEHKEADAKSDQYALGHLLHTALVGRSPFAHMHGIRLVRGILGSEHARLRDSGRELPAGLTAAVERAMSVAPDRRYPSVLAFAQAIAEYAADRERIPPELLAARQPEPPADADEDDSLTEVDVPLGTAESKRATVDLSAVAAAKVVPVAPFAAMSVVSTTERMPTATAIDVSFVGGQHPPMPGTKAPAPLLRKPAAEALRSVASSAGPRRNRSLVLAAVLVVVALVVLALAIALRASVGLS